MTAPTKKPGARAGIAGDVAEYLRAHPGFFNEFPELLTEIEVPHPSGEAVSLVAKQVAALREQNEHLRKRMHELIEIARRNEELAKRLHQLALTLMDATDSREIFATLYENLRRNFRADSVIVKLFAKPAFIDTFPGEEFVGPEIREKELFKHIIEK